MNQNVMSQPQSMKPFLVIWIGNAVSLLGSLLVQFALIWWLTQTTGSATVLAMASLVGLMPQIVLGPFAGVLVDRWNRRLTMLAADGAVAVATIALAYLFWIDAAQVWHVFIILFIRALGGTFHWPAMMASTSLMVPKVHLTRIQGFNQMLNGGLNIVAAPLGALLLSILPLQGILGIDVVTALFAIVPLLFIPIPQPERRPESELAGPVSFRSSFWVDMRQGLRYIRTWPGLLVLTGMAMLIKVLLTPAFALLPLLVTDTFKGGPLQLGILEAAVGVGIVLGGLLLGIWGGFPRRILTILCGLIGMGLGLLLVGLTPASLFALAVGGILWTGITVALIDGPLLAIMQASVAPEMQGRVFMLFGSLISSTGPLGLILAGPLADVVGTQVWFIAAGAVTILMAAAGFFMPALLNIEDHGERAEELDEVDIAGGAAVTGPVG
ncbi:MAG TPA: MFS transporter [Anaerolineae bacterium]